MAEFLPWIFFNEDYSNCGGFRFCIVFNRAISADSDMGAEKA